MCGIAGIVSTSGAALRGVAHRLAIMDRLIAHRGPDGQGIWISAQNTAGFCHRRLSIIDLSEAAAQPMTSEAGSVITYNGEIYNYPELRAALSAHWTFRTHSDTEVILA